MSDDESPTKYPRLRLIKKSHYLQLSLRLPDTDTLARNPTTRQNLCAFLAKTVPKQSVYGIHSGYRMLFEDRPPKLCRRLPSDADATDHLELTMSWVVAGPTITDLHDDITATLREELTRVRESIAEGTEQAPTLTIPVRDATTYPAIRRVIDEVAMTHDIQWTARERQRLVRLCLRSFGPADTQRTCSYDIVVSLLRALSESPHPTPADVERAAATLPAERFRPDLTPTATKLYATLCSAEQPLGRSELIDRAEISASSYDRRLRDIRALDRVQPVQVDGHRRWIVDDEESSLPPGSWWLPSVDAPSHSTPLTHQDTTHTRTNVVTTTRWLQTHDHSSTHTVSRQPTPPAAEPEDTSLPLNLRSCYRDEHMLQLQTHPTIRSRAQRHHTKPRNPTMQATHPTTAPTTQPTLHPNQWGERQ